MANEVKLQEGHPVDENLRPIKIGGKSSSLELSQNGNGARISGDLEITGSVPAVRTNRIVSTDLVIDGCDVSIGATKKLYFDGTGNKTYLQESSDAPDTLLVVVGDDTIMQMQEIGAWGNQVIFNEASAGFTRQEATFSATGVIGSAGTDDTDIDFRISNKYRLEMTGDITTINLIFPPMSGNFLLVCTTDGDHDVSNWKVFLSTEGASAHADVLWAGGSVPAFTNNGIDIVSFYWDKDDRQAYGVASLAFAAP